MESIACEKWTVSLLKQYLRDRAVPHSGYCKEKLVKLVKNSHENPSLVDQVEPTDGESVSESRRTITVNGDVVVFPDPHLLTGWDDNLTKIPSITSACCLIYLMNKKGWPAKRLENFENERGYQLCNDNHINTVQIKPHDGNMSYIRAKCIRQTAQKESPYCVWLLATNRGNIEASGCQCIGDDGSCKHVVALMYAVANFVHRNEVSLSIQRPTPTDLLCTWDKPHKSSEPLRIYHTDGRFVHST
ncbi:hypothetical protein GWK47_014566 [Chionoecetes opilio]|uniref:SWIM-type domain-containing protein n=1 Tax=Chionoecetes opilio TaxID=41210 RepID=A0A8J4XUN7_CHIOP|nr:hypothetical protein GWK47_014566 [Chionoecetes opilio]